MHIDAKTHTTLARVHEMLERKSARTAVPPQGAQKAGQRALELVKAGRAGQGFTSVGRARASQLARGSALGEDTVRRMNNYFTRHAGDKKPGWSDAGSETPGYVAWLAWGGDAGATWAAAQVRKWDREDGKKEFPHYLPNGEDVQTVEQVAAMLHTTKGVAAAYVLEEKGLPDALYQEAKSLKAPPKGDKSGVALMLLIPAVSARQLVQAGGTPAEDLHITLGYWGDKEDVENEEHLQMMAASLAQEFGPFTVQLNGLTRFSTESEAGDPVVVNADAPQIEAMRSRLTELADDFGAPFKSEHGYTPHMTIGYLDPDEDMPMQRWKPVTVKVSMFVMSIGTDHTVYKLGDRKPQKKDVFNGNPGLQSARMSPVLRAESVLEAARRRRRKREQEAHRGQS